VTTAATAAELYDDLAKQHGFSLPGARLRVAINDAFVPWTTPLQEGDGLVFIPPVAGG
jgi:molybdopterin converting factor small subunit